MKANKLGLAVVYNDMQTGFQDYRILKCFRNCKSHELKKLRKNEEVWVEILPGKFPGAYGYLRVRIVNVEQREDCKIVYWEDTDCGGKEIVFVHNPTRTSIVKLSKPHKLFEIIQQDVRAIKYTYHPE
jgi:hypothetical protein